MNDRTYLNMMIAFQKVLEKATSSEPYDHASFVKTLEAMNRTTRLWNHSHRRRPWFALGFCISLMIVLLFIVYEILSLLYMRGIQ